jgi:uncharacterized protein (TIRG00374 family)
MKSLKKNSIILFIITAIVLVCVLKDDFPSIISTLAEANLFWIFIALLCFFVALGFEARAYQLIIKGYQSKYTFKKSYIMLVITKFFNGITPFSSGGQPMQIYMLKQEGIRLTKATNIIIQNFIIYQLALVILGIIAIITNNFFKIFTEVTLLKQLVTLGFLVNTLVMVGLIIISFSSKFNHFIIRKTISILYKLKLVKNKEEKLENWKEKVDDFHEGTTYLKNNKMLCFKAFIYNLIYLSLTYLMPYFVIIGLAKTIPDGVTPIKVICSSAYVMIMGSFVPIPGASGGIEFGYYKFFGNFIKGTILKASLLIWRTVSYYLPMIIGGILFNINTKRGDQE